jgi:hypothetical protein
MSTNFGAESFSNDMVLLFLLNHFDHTFEETTLGGLQKLYKWFQSDAYLVYKNRRKK